MKYALVDEELCEATYGERGVCLYCGSLMIAKCGRYISWHWSHRSKKNCDPWWENESQWHRDWKDCFPIDWQEVIHTDTDTGEKHIADVKTASGLVLEFQSSPIKSTEVESRERFYSDMLWIINGDRADALDNANFNVDLVTSHVVISQSPLRIEFTAYASKRLYRKWANTEHPLYIDYGEGLVWKLEMFDAASSRVRLTQSSKAKLAEQLGGKYLEVP